MEKLTKERLAELREKWFDPDCSGFEQELVRELLIYIQGLEEKIGNPRYGIYAEQVANLILTEPETGEEMVVTSPIHTSKDGSYWFVTKALQGGTYWKHTIRTEEINGLPG